MEKTKEVSMAKVIDEELLASAKSGKKKSGRGDLVKYLQGKRLTQRQAIRAKCYDCNGMGEETYCDIEGCSLLPYSPYRASQRTAPLK